jgi:hypothetical protein
VVSVVVVVVVVVSTGSVTVVVVVGPRMVVVIVPEPVGQGVIVGHTAQLVGEIEGGEGVVDVSGVSVLEPPVVVVIIEPPVVLEDVSVAVAVVLGQSVVVAVSAVVRVLVGSMVIVELVVSQGSMTSTSTSISKSPTSSPGFGWAATKPRVCKNRTNARRVVDRNILEISS